MRVLVVGGAGYIGEWVVSELESRNIACTVYDNLTYTDQYLRDTPFVYGDIRDTDKLAQAVNAHTHVIWLAAIVGDPACGLLGDEAYEVNVGALRKLMFGAGVGFEQKRIVFASSCSVYGYRDGELDEQSPVNPLSTYAQHKLEIEHQLAGLNAVCLRFGTAFGLSHHARMRFDLAINRMSIMGAVEGRIEVHSGNQWRPFASVNDIGYAVVEALSTAPGIYNIVTENCTIEGAGEQVWRTQTMLGHVSISVEDAIEDNRSYRVKSDKAWGVGLLLPKSRVTIRSAARQIYIARDRFKDWQAPQHNNYEWLKRGR